MKKGDVVLISFPFTNLLNTKVRPALVLVTTEQDVTVAFITSQLSYLNADDILLKPNLANGLKVVSAVKLSKIATIQKSLSEGKLGELSATEIQSIDKGLVKVFDIR